MILRSRKELIFDVTNEDHLQSVRRFMEKSSWGPEGCPFKLEYPWTNIPDMIKDKIICKFLDIEVA